MELNDGKVSNSYILSIDLVEMMNESCIHYKANYGVDYLLTYHSNSSSKQF